MNLIGREAELGALREAFAGDAPTLGVSGPPGVGKTALVRSFLAALARDGEAVLAVPELWSIGTGEDWIEQLGAALGFAGRSGDPKAAIDDLASALGAQGAPLVWLDGADSTLLSAHPLCQELVARVPGQRFIISSRAVLARPAFSLRLEPLALPVTQAELESAPASQLFLREARAARPDFSLTEGDAPYVFQLVHWLDGLPLAIELAAPRLSVMGPRALLHRLRSHPSALRSATPEARHGSLFHTIEASLLALTPKERTTLTRLSVFEGGFTVESAEAVVDLGMAGVDALARLRQAALLRATSGADGEIRLAPYPPVRQLAWRELGESGERAVTLERHAQYFVTEAERKAQSARSGPRAERERCRTWLAEERGNLLAVVQRSLEKQPPPRATAELALRALVALGQDAIGDGRLENCASWVERAVAATEGSGAAPALRANALLLRGALHLQRVDAQGAARDGAEVLVIARALRDPDLEARGLALIGNSLGALGDETTAADPLEEAARIYRQRNDNNAASAVERRLVPLLLGRGDTGRARLLLERAIATHRASGDACQLADAQLELGHLELNLGNLAEAIQILLANQQDHLALGRAREAARAAGFACVAQQVDSESLESHPECADQALDRAIQATAAQGDRLGEAELLSFRALLAWCKGDEATAYVLLQATLARAAEGTEPMARKLLLAELERRAKRRPQAEDWLRQVRSSAAKRPQPLLQALLLLDESVEDAAAALRPLATHSAFARLALRALEQRPLQVAGSSALLIGRDGTWFEAAGAARMSLLNRPQLVRLLRRLVTEHAAFPGRAVSRDELLTAVWPGERMLDQAASQRLRVAVATLRKLGLREFIETSNGGYFLSVSTTLRTL